MSDSNTTSPSYHHTASDPVLAALGSEFEVLYCEAPERAWEGLQVHHCRPEGPCFYVNFVKAPRPDLNVKAARLQHGGLHRLNTVIIIIIIIIIV